MQMKKSNICQKMMDDKDMYDTKICLKENNVYWSLLVVTSIILLWLNPWSES